MLTIHTNVPLAPLTTFKLGGPARFLVRVKNVAQLEEAFDFAQEQGVNTLVLGGGSNVLFADTGFDGLVVKMNLRGREFVAGEDAVLLKAGAGETWDDLVRESVARRLGGIENLSLIPGSMGGAVYQNIGAYGRELKDVLMRVQALDLETRRMRSMAPSACRLRYRDSLFQRARNLVILSATVKLSPCPEPLLVYPDLKRHFDGRHPPTLQQVRRAVVKIRKGKFPYAERLGNAGSFFKNPVLTSPQFQGLLERHPDLKSFPFGADCVKVPAAQLIEKAGWKGQRLGRVGVSERHALVLVHYGGGTSGELLDLARRIVSDVEKQFGIVLRPEVHIVATRDTGSVNW